MTLTAGVLSQVLIGSTTASLISTAASGGSGPYTQQWYRSTATGFTPGAGTLIAGATALTLNDSGLIPNTAYFYRVRFTDTGNSNVTIDSAQLAVATAVPALNPNQFALTPLLGTLDQRFPYNTHPVMIAPSQVGSLYFGAAVKGSATTSGGLPQVVSCAANTDQVLGFINFDIKTIAFVAGMPCEISMSGNYMYLYATTAITQFAQVTVDLTTNGGVQAAVTGDRVVGWAYDGAAAPGKLIRVALQTPSFLLAP